MTARDRMLKTVGQEFAFRNEGARSKRAVLLIHGVAGGPLQVRELGERIHQSLDNDCYGYLLPAHCISYDELSCVTYPRWTRSVERLYSKLREQYQHVDVCGFSLGGVLALNLARTHHIPNLIVLAAPMWFTHESLPLEKLIRGGHKRLPRLPAPQIKWSVAGYDNKPVTARVPTEKFFPPHLLYQLMLIMRQVREHVHETKCGRALLVHSKADPWAAVKSATWVHQRLSCKDKHLRHLRFAYHEFLTGKYKDIVIGHVLDFLQES